MRYDGCKLPDKCWCKECQRKYDSERWKTRDKEAWRQRKNEHRQETIKWMDELKASIPCADCQIKYPAIVMDWDHDPNQVKVANISDLIRSGRRQKAEKEILKCELVCSNCHRIRTYNRLRVV